MNAIRKILDINEKELLRNVPDNASWHADYSDTPYIYIGNLHDDIKKEDIVIIFSQYGNPTHVNMIKDKETGKSRGFCYLKYEDHRSCALAIDNFNGVKVYERPLKVDHTYYKLVNGQQEDDFLVEYPKLEALDEKPAQPELEPKLLEFHEKLDDDNDFEDPMANFDKLAVELASKPRKSGEKRHRHHHHLDRLSKRSSSHRKRRSSQES